MGGAYNPEILSVSSTFLEKKAMRIRPMYDRVVVRRLPVETKTSGGIVIPDKSAGKSTRGEVLAVGPGKLLDDGTTATLAVKTGDQVLFGEYAGTEISLDGDKVLIIKEQD